MIGVVLPSRGLIFAEVLESLQENLIGKEHWVYISHDLPIPDCENYLTEKALEDGSEYLWFIEEDTIPPNNALRDLLNADSDIAAIDYGVAGWSCITRSKIDNEILWCGMGCTLIKREVFAALEKPYFRSDLELSLNDMTWNPSPKDKYGGQDIWFCTKAREKGFKIKQVEGEAKHLKLETLGVPEINNGLHVIVEKPKITKHTVL